MLPKTGETVHFLRREPDALIFATVWESTDFPSYYHCRAETLRGGDDFWAKILRNEIDDVSGETVFSIRPISCKRYEHRDGRSTVPVWDMLAAVMEVPVVTKQDVHGIGKITEREIRFEAEANEAHWERLTGKKPETGQNPS